MTTGKAKKKIDLTEDRLFSLGWGLIYKPVCAPKSWSGERVAKEATKNDPPGTSANEWVITNTEDCDDDDPFRDANPIPCPDCEDRQHWLVNC